MARIHAYSSATLAPARCIWRGAFPEVQSLAESVVPGWMQGYVTTYLQRDVRTLLEVRDETQFATFLGLCGALTAQECNYNHLGRDIGLSPVSAKRWIGALRGTYQWLEVPAFSANAIKRLSGRSKGYMTDTGLACYLLRLSSPEAVQSHPAYGALFETLVIMECHRQLQQRNLVPPLYHYRQHSGAEVDLIIEKDGWFFPVEIKSASAARPVDAHAHAALRQNTSNRIGPGLVIYAGSDILRLDEQTIAVPFDLA